MQHATVITTFSRRMRLRLADGQEVEARIKGKRMKPVCGDEVEAEPIPGEADWLITKIADRRTELTRPNMRGQIEVLAANMDYMLVVAAAEPAPDWFIVDRYLCAAEVLGIGPAVVYNKIDIESEIPADELETYRSIGYDVVSSSAETGAGIEDLLHLLEDHLAIIVGQSGVGKSSIINRILGFDAQLTGNISDKSREGRHTTVNSSLIRLPGGGAMIDSPGVRDYAPALDSSSMAAEGFREIRAAAEDCRFANCRHLREPGCAVKSRCDHGTISARRYQSYKRIVNLTEQLSEGRY